MKNAIPAGEDEEKGTKGWPAEWIDPPLLALSFLTRIPVRRTMPGVTLADACVWFPVVGILVGAAAGLVLFLASVFSLPAPIAAGLALACAVLLTGALHEDGLAVVADGFGGGATAERTLEIMRDSRIGTYGTLALIFSVGLKWLLLTSIATAGPTGAILALITAHTLSRAILPPAMTILPPARGDGLGATAGRPGWPRSVGAAALGSAVVIVLLPYFALGAIAATALGGVIIGWIAWRRIGGQTGDVLGAIQQICEIFILMALVSALA
ncbi:MAG: adenosylcobinamide-GDP ribazoletransferase [Alphaproteobacteria bacterium]|nr:adenosylcobinamide-GDP ribazoletransferase [Alphaproteobacteria bacterium]